MGVRLRGFSLKHRVSTLFRRVLRSRHRCRRLNPSGSHHVRSFSRFLDWSICLRSKAKAILSGSGPRYIRVGQEPLLDRPDPIPKGHLAVYVGQKDGDFQRILVPVVYFNHPLFGDLLKESEKEFGFDHTGGIKIPCRISEFERVQTRIQSVQCTRKGLSWRRGHRHWEMS